MTVLAEIGRHIADQLALSSVLPSRKLPLDERWARAESSLSLNQQALFVRREISDLAQKPEVAVTKRMVEACSLPEEVKNFLLNPPKTEGISRRFDLKAGASISKSDKRSNMPYSIYGVHIYMMPGGLNPRHILAAKCL
ncbi:MAG: hypothetical protein Q7R82_02675, partial [Candidatus Daviesbacteria bacterium]|nr:hypothetical protein [Candidatus Daviesbacteria bacterium]